MILPFPRLKSVCFQKEEILSPFIIGKSKYQKAKPHSFGMTGRRDIIVFRLIKMLIYKIGSLKHSYPFRLP